MGTQTEIAKQIVAKKADYVLALKANHPTLHSQVQQWFQTAVTNNFRGVDVSYHKRIEKADHRREIREVWSVPVSAIGQLYQHIKIFLNFDTLLNTEYNRADFSSLPIVQLKKYSLEEEFSYSEFRSGARKAPPRRQNQSVGDSAQSAVLGSPQEEQLCS